MKPLQSFFAGAAAGLMLLGVSPAAAEVVYGVVPGAGGFAIRSFDLATGTLQKRGTIAMPLEKLTGFGRLGDGTFLLTSAPAPTSRIAPQLNRLTLVGAGTARLISGLRQKETIESAVVTESGTLVATVARESAPPFRLVNINLATGRATAWEGELKLGLNRRFANLTQCPDGRLYATSLPAEGQAHLVYLDEERQQVTELAQFSLDEKGFRHDLLSLACSPTGQLYAVADPELDGRNALFSVEIMTGRLSPIAAVPFSKFVFARP